MILRFYGIVVMGRERDLVDQSSVIVRLDGVKVGGGSFDGTNFVFRATADGTYTFEVFGKDGAKVSDDTNVSVREDTTGSVGYVVVHSAELETATTIKLVIASNANDR